MKHWFLFILVISWFCFPLSGQQTNRPDWVKQHPVSGLSYIGIGMAEISEGDYQQKAKQNHEITRINKNQCFIRP